MGILEVLTAPRSPWQNAYAERFIGSLRRECLDHMIIVNESTLKRILKHTFNTTGDDDRQGRLIYDDADTQQDEDPKAA